METPTQRSRVKTLIERFVRSSVPRRLGELGEWIGKITVFIGIITYFTESGDRAKQRHYQAWQVLDLARDTRK